MGTSRAPLTLGCGDHMFSSTMSDNLYWGLLMWRDHRDVGATTWGLTSEDIMWRQHGDNMGINIWISWRPHVDNVETTWGQCGDHGDVETTWGQHGLQHDGPQGCEIHHVGDNFDEMYMGTVNGRLNVETWHWDNMGTTGMWRSSWGQRGWPWGCTDLKWGQHGDSF